MSFPLGSAGFSPTRIPGLALWLDAALAGSALVDGDVAESGARISDWKDRSGRRNDVSQADSGSRPRYVEGLLNGLPGIVFDGEDDMLSRANWLVEPGTVLVVGDVPEGGAVAAMAIQSTDAIAAPAFELYANRSGIATTGTRAARATSADNASATDLAANGATNAATATVFGARCSGAAIQVFGPSATAEASDGTANNLRPLGGSLTVGAANSGDFLGGHVYELLVYARPLGFPEIRSIIAYLRAKWAV